MDEEDGLRLVCSARAGEGIRGLGF
jgi:uncharacterized 2Fe-2S/4Fe-4S cluster protein (DUF4445 family)